MELNIDFGNPMITEEQLSKLSTDDLNGFYASASEIDRLNLFFVLLNSMQHFEGKGEQQKTAYLCFLLAYYLFVPLTPPGSCSLALHYIEKAIALDPKQEYREWLTLMQKGN